MVPRCRAFLPRACLRGKGRRQPSGVLRVGESPARQLDLGAAPLGDGADPGWPAAHGRRAGRPCRRLPAEHPADDRGVPGDHIARRDLVLLLARLRVPDDRRPVRADRAEGPARGRRIPLRRQELRPFAADRPASRSAADRRAHGRAPLPRRPRRLGCRLRADRGLARVHAGAVRPPAVDRVLERHDRIAQGDRPRARRDRARAPEELPAAPRRPSRRSRHVVHNHGLDHVELPRERIAERRVDRALRRQSRVPRPRRPMGPRRAVASDPVRVRRRVHPRLHEGRNRSGRRARPVGAALDRIDGVAARARGVRLDLRAPGK